MSSQKHKKGIKNFTVIVPTLEIKEEFDWYEDAINLVQQLRKEHRDKHIRLYRKEHLIVTYNEDTYSDKGNWMYCCDGHEVYCRCAEKQRSMRMKK
jgi:hypothetical protein